MPHAKQSSINSGQGDDSLFHCEKKITKLASCLLQYNCYKQISQSEMMTNITVEKRNDINMSFSFMDTRIITVSFNLL